LTYNPLNDLPAVMGNANGLSQVLSNLLTNAVNYTPAGGRVILETNVKARKKQNWVVISIIDNGTGIAEDEIPYIFDRFFRGSASQVTGAEGTGLGLAISKELVSRMGGEITFESSPGKGSTFNVWLRPAVSAML
jgi:signal transduction histidine kinase